jgi:hypothetical protein
MRRRVWLVGSVLGLCLLTGIVPVAGAAAPSARDLTSTNRFVTAVTRYYRSALAHRPAETAAVKAMVAGVTTGCPGSLPKSLAKGTAGQQKVYLQLALEAGLDLGIADVAPLRGALSAQARALGRLRWASAKLDREIRAEMELQRATVKLVPSQLCADIKTAAAGGYATLPSATTRFLTATVRAESQRVPTLSAALTLMKPDITPAEAPAVKRLRALAATFRRFTGTLLTGAGKNLEAALSTTST